jgi:hypothetical protein
VRVIDPNSGESGSATGPLSPQHLAELAAAKRASRAVRRTASIARASAWTTGILAGLTLLGVLFGDVVSLVLGAALMAVAIRESRLAGRLAQLDPRAPGALAINQLLLGAIIVAYAAWQIRAALASSGLSAVNAPIGDPQVDAMLANIGAVSKRIMVAFYACVATGGVLGTGLMALHYRSRQPLLRRFLTTTPPWVTQLLRAA